MARIGSGSRLGWNLKSYVWVCPDSAFELSAGSRWCGVVAISDFCYAGKKKIFDTRFLLAYEISYLKSNTASIGAVFDYIRLIYEISYLQVPQTGRYPRPADPSSWGTLRSKFRSRTAGVIN